MVSFKGCQIVALGNSKKHCAIKSKIYKNAYIAIGKYEDCRRILKNSDGPFKSLEQNTILTYFSLNYEIIPANELKPISKEIR